MTHRVAVLNGKGGTLKTTVAANVAGHIAASGARVLLVDLDPQGNLRLDLGIDDTDLDDDGKALAQALMFDAELAPVEVRDNLDLVVGGPALARVALTPEHRDAAAIALADVEDDYDLVIIDSAPGAGELRMLTLTTATALILPTQSDRAGLAGVEQVARDIRAVKRSTNPGLQVLGAVVGPVPSTATAVVRQTRHMLEELMGERVPVFEPAVPYSVAVATLARHNGLLVSELAHQLREDRRGFTEHAPVTPPADATVAAVDDAYRQIAQQTIDALASQGGQ